MRELDPIKTLHSSPISIYFRYSGFIPIVQADEPGGEAGGWAETAVDSWGRGRGSLHAGNFYISLMFGYNLKPYGT